MRKALAAVIAISAAAFVFAAVAMANGSGGVTGPSFYVDGQLYRTVGTPTDLSNTGGPASSFDTIYDFGGLQSNVATAAPGDPGYNGGRARDRREPLLGDHLSPDRRSDLPGDVPPPPRRLGFLAAVTRI